MHLKKICNIETARLNAGFYWFEYSRLSSYYLDLVDLGWKFYVVDQTRGFCRPSHKLITIPLWCVKRATTKTGQHRLVQYILHEIAHALDYIAGNKDLDHGKEFMDILIKICPAELLIYEMTYKPKNLVAAGAVFCPESLNF